MISYVKPGMGGGDEAHIGRNTLLEALLALGQHLPVQHTGV